MNFFILLVLIGFQCHAELISTYRLEQNSKIYTINSNLAFIFEIEKEAIYQSTSSDDFLLVARQLNSKNQQDIKGARDWNIYPTTNIDPKLVLQKLILNPVAGNVPLNSYNQENNTGFCFGRALFVEKELLKMGVNKESIRKVFVLGELTNGQIMWEYHVATMYIDSKGRKHMIDSLFDEVHELEIWFQKMNKYALNKENPLFRIYFAEADKFQARDGYFNSADILDPRYRNYFFDLMIWL
jgi:hypothetical protein